MKAQPHFVFRIWARLKFGSVFRSTRMDLQSLWAAVLLLGLNESLEHQQCKYKARWISWISNGLDSSWLDGRLHASDRNKIVATKNAQNSVGGWTLQEGRTHGCWNPILSVVLQARQQLLTWPSINRSCFGIGRDFLGFISEGWLFTISSPIIKSCIRTWKRNCTLGKVWNWAVWVCCYDFL